MTKPWEQEWRDVGGPCGGRIVNDADDVLADEVTDDALPLMLAAPDMARELMHLVRLLEPLERDSGLNVPGLATLNGARAALRKARVIP